MFKKITLSLSLLSLVVNILGVSIVSKAFESSSFDSFYTQTFDSFTADKDYTAMLDDSYYFSQEDKTQTSYLETSGYDSSSEYDKPSKTLSYLDESLYAPSFLTMRYINNETQAGSNNSTCMTYRGNKYTVTGPDNNNYVVTVNGEETKTRHGIGCKVDGDSKSETTYLLLEFLQSH
jgi:hypothetical protein